MQPRSMLSLRTQRRRRVVEKRRRRVVEKTWAACRIFLVGAVGSRRFCDVCTIARGSELDRVRQPP